MLELLSYLESIIRFISLFLSTGFSLQRLKEIQEENGWETDTIFFVSSIVCGFVLGILFSYFSK